MASAQATQGLAPGNGAGAGDNTGRQTIQDGSKRFVVAGYWIDELDNWSFLEHWVSANAIAWRPLPEPFAGGVVGYNRKEAAK